MSDILEMENNVENGEVSETDIQKKEKLASVPNAMMNIAKSCCIFCMFYS
jgi:hypothetical protein